MKTTYNLILTLLFVSIGHICFAQSIQITGTVTIVSDGLPLPGATVVIKGTTTGTQTDFDGKYTLSANVGDILSFSYVGLEAQEITVTGAKVIDVALKEDTSALEEVVVIGYGTQSRRKLTDNIVSASAEDIKGVPTPNLFNSLAGKLVGVQINQQNGKVEAGLNVRIRGLGSVGAGSEPLYVIDGVILANPDLSSNGAPTNPLITLSPSEIESIDILKDASSGAIYGARGANGVVIITTKSGRSGQARFSVNIANGVSRASNTREWLNSAEYIELFSEAADRSGFSTAFIEGQFERLSNGTDWRNLEVDTDWQDIALIDGYTRDADFSVGGGDEKTSYFFSGAYNDTKGIVLGNTLERISARTNITHQFTDKLNMGMNMSYSRVINERIANDNSFTTPLQAIAQSPLSPAYNDDGSANPNTQYVNFLAQQQNGYYTTQIRRVLGKVFAEYAFIPELKFRTDFSYDLYTQTEDQWTGRLAPFQSTNGEVFAGDDTVESFVWSNYFTYDKTFNDIHDLNVVVGTELQKSDTRRTDVTGIEFPTDDLQTINSAAEITAGTGFETFYAFSSYFARATYALKGRYLLKASIRRDGSSRFGSEERWGTFTAVSAGWILSEEDFLADSETINFLKLRGSWGQLGNAEIGNFGSLALFGGTSYNNQSGIRPTQVGNANLTWESSDQLDVGVEFGLFNNRLSGDVAYYIKDTDGLIFAVPLSTSTGAQSGINQNIGRLQNKGIEISLNSRNIETENFLWTTNFNIGQVDNEVKSLPGGNDIISGRNILREGETRDAFFLPEYAGVNPANGDALYVLNTIDTNGNLDRSLTTNVNEAERIIAGNPYAEWIGGLTNTFKYKNWDFNFTFQGEWGASIFNGGGIFQSANADFYDNQSRDQLRRWQNPGDITDVPEARLFGGNGTARSTRYLQEADFIRLRNVTLGYTLPEEAIKKMGLTSVRFYVTGFNLATFTDYDGYDVEVRADSGGTGQVIYTAPTPTTISVGANFNF
jgi:TonB-linked SusC/RagA family outer membrane protein